MIYWIYNIKVKEEVSSDSLLTELGKLKIWCSALVGCTWWLGHVECSSVWISQTCKLKVVGQKKKWDEVVRTWHAKDLVLRISSVVDWSRRVQHRLDLQNMQAKASWAEENVGGIGENLFWIEQSLETALSGVGIFKEDKYQTRPTLEED